MAQESAYSQQIGAQKWTKARWLPKFMNAKKLAVADTWEP